MQSSQKPLLLHDDAEAQALIERIKQLKLAEQTTIEKSSEGSESIGLTPRFLFSQNLC
jgi:hypothetical protein